ncbi:50S ribosomal protein L4 [Patescibacteria group bacterium]|nr:50S ribosomal protein L4 [Patescibacteria group bacterium]
MLKAKVYNQSGEVISEIELNPNIFEIPVKESLIQQVVEYLRSQSQQVLAHAKDRGQVRGGGKKPWKQKGTGRARHGSIRSPLWRGGGVTFGPNAERNFSLKLNKKMKKKALFMVLSDRAKADVIMILQKLELPESKTKEMIKLLQVLNLKKGTLLVIDKMNENIVRAANNIQGVNVITVNSLNVIDTLKANNLLFTADALKELENVFLKEAK